LKPTLQFQFRGYRWFGVLVRRGILSVMRRLSTT